MGFKKNETSETSKEQEHSYLTWLPIALVVNSEKVIKQDQIVKYELGNECSATFFADTDGVSINIWGFEFWCKVRKGSKGRFLSFPSYQKKDNTYGDYVKCFDKGFHALMGELITHIYG